MFIVIYKDLIIRKYYEKLLSIDNRNNQIK